MTQHQIYWWNLENLFDTEDSALRPEWLKKALSKELTGWTKEVLDNKIENLTNIICRFNQGKGPDIMGVCEIENKNVVDLLAAKIGQKTGKTYKALHHDTKDKRGIDIAFIYDEEKYKTVGDLFTLEIMKRSATRDVIQMTFQTTGNHEFTLLGMHFPSRTGGKYETEPYRIMAAETTAYWIERIHEVKGIDHPVILMGDFNDEPFDRSMTQYLLSSKLKAQVINAQKHLMFNPMCKFLGDETGTHVYGSEVSILDQFLVSRSIITKGAGNPFKFDSVEIICYPEMIKGRYNTPVRFGRPQSKDYNRNGYSDHLPVKLVLTEI